MSKQTLMIKAKFSNAVHRILETNISMPYRERWMHEKKWSNADKLKAFDDIFQLHKEHSGELRSFRLKKQSIKRRDKARIARGWSQKKKTLK